MMKGERRIKSGEISEVSRRKSTNRERAIQGYSCEIDSISGMAFNIRISLDQLTRLILNTILGRDGNYCLEGKPASCPCLPRVSIQDGQPL